MFCHCVAKLFQISNCISADLMNYRFYMVLYKKAEIIAGKVTSV
jgi:hypothetical protein